MSYIRFEEKLRFFKKAKSSYCVFPHVDGHVEDYDASYGVIVSCMDIIGRIVENETGDHKYAVKIVTLLCRRLGIRLKEIKGLDI